MSDSDSGDRPPTLSDVLEALVTSVSRARVQADIRSAQISQMYRKHDLLRGMPVPRLRLNRVQINLPIVVTAVEKGTDFKLAEPGQIARRVVEELRRGVEGLQAGLLGDVAHALEDGSAIVRDSEAGKLVERLHITLSDALLYLSWSVGELSDSALEQLASKLAPPGAASGAASAGSAAPEVIPQKEWEGVAQLYDSEWPPGTSSSDFVSKLEAAFQSALLPFEDGRSLRDATTELTIQELCGEVVQRLMRHQLALRCGQLHKVPTTARLGFDLDDSYPILSGEQEPPRAQGGGKLSGLRGPYAEQLYAELLNAVPKLVERLSALAGTAALRSTGTPPEVMVAAHTVDVKNESTPATVTRLNIMLTEEGLQWIAESSEPGADPNWKLMPE